MHSVDDVRRRSRAALIAVGLALLLVMLRFEAEHFGAAEYDEPTRDGTAARPAPARVVRAGHRGVAVAICTSIRRRRATCSWARATGSRRSSAASRTAPLGALRPSPSRRCGTAACASPTSRSYPGALLNSIATAFMDEAVFRGLLFGLCSSVGLDPTLANVIQTLVYALATRLGAPGRRPILLVLVLAIGLFCGWLTL